jgi:hypothetical protein
MLAEEPKWTEAVGDALGDVSGHTSSRCKICSSEAHWQVLSRDQIKQVSGAFESVRAVNLA